MQCCVCKEKRATVHLTQIVGDKLQKLDFCEDCAKSKGFNIDDPSNTSMMSLADLLAALGTARASKPRNAQN
jgi:protein arginine kinase activator